MIAKSPKKSLKSPQYSRPSSKLLEKGRYDPKKSLKILNTPDQMAKSLERADMITKGRYDNKKVL